MIEVEKKARFAPEEKTHIVQTILAQPGVQDLGPNHTKSVFYLAADQQTKVQHAISKGTAKIAWKSGGNDGASSRREIEVGILPDQAENAEALIEAILPNAKRFPTQQQRHDYALPGGVTVSIKHSPDWGDHLEIDNNVADASEVSAALERLQAIADVLGVHLLTENEEQAFVASRINAREQAKS